MPEFLLAPFANATPTNPVDVLIRLVVAALFGALVAVVYRFTRRREDVAGSFTITLVLLTVLIAMVTQVIGDNIARAFSLVGALSIVRFRTVVRDTQDTAYVIFAVAVGMAIGASAPWVAAMGFLVVAVTALLMRRPDDEPSVSQLPYLLHVRLALGHEASEVLGPSLAQHTSQRRLTSLATARQGMSLDVSYRVALAKAESAAELVTALNRIEGVQSVALQRVEEEN